MRKAVVLLAVLPMLFGCSYRGTSSSVSDPVVETDSQKPSEVGISSPMSTSSQKPDKRRVDFSVNLFKAASLNQNDKTSNLVISPFSAGEALSMLLEGADGSTREEILSALSSSSFAGLALEKDESVEVSSANSMWIRAGFPVKDDFRRTLEGSYGAQVFSRPFNSSTVGEINSWCSENTNGKIPTILNSISPENVMFILNALYFKAPWMYSFNKNATAQMTFHGLKGDERGDFMGMTRDFAYAEVEGFQVIKLPYKGGRYAMLVALPSKSMPLNDVLPYLEPDHFRSALDMLQRRKVNLTLPKFKIEGEVTLNPVLQDMGMKRAFSSGADFSRMTSSSVSVDYVKQKTYIEVSEQGTEAAAVTSIGVSLTSVRVETEPVYMTVDRPFIFSIYDVMTDDILFIGNIRSIK